MPELINAVVLQGEPAKVFAALVDPAQRATWGPVVYLDDPSHVGPTVCGFPIRSRADPMRLDASVDALVEAEAFAWRCGIRWIFTFGERFELDALAGRTSMTHRIVVGGALGLLVGWFILPQFDRLMLASDDRLAAYLRSRAERPPPVPFRSARPQRRGRPPR